MIPVIDNPLFLAAFAAITLTAGFVAAAIARACRKKTEKAAPVSRTHACAHLLLAVIITGLCAGGIFLLLPRTPDALMLTGNQAYDVLFCTWLALAFVCGVVWHHVFAVLYTRKRGCDA